MSQVESAAQLRAALAVQDVLEVVEQHLSVVECGAFSYLSLEKDLVILIMPIVLHPTKLQVCDTNGISCTM